MERFQNQGQTTFSRINPKSGTDHVFPSTGELEPRFLDEQAMNKLSRFKTGTCRLEITNCDFKFAWVSLIRDRGVIEQGHGDCAHAISDIESRIIVIRGHKVLLSTDLARLYGVSVKVLNQAVRRNLERFPEDFMFQLGWDDVRPLRSQIVTLKAGSGVRGAHSKYRPFAFTEQGIAMLSSVLRSGQAVQASIAIMRAFVRLREMVVSHKDLSKRLDDLEARYNRQFKVVFDAIRQLMQPPDQARRRRIGFL